MPNGKTESCPFGERNHEDMAELQRVVQNNAQQIATLTAHINTINDRHNFYRNSLIMLLIGVVGALLQGYMAMGGHK